MLAVTEISCPPISKGVSSSFLILSAVRADLLQGLIPCSVAPRVVHYLEVVQIQEQDDHSASTPVRPHQTLLQAAHEEGAVGKPGQGIVRSLVRELLGEDLTSGDIAG